MQICNLQAESRGGRKMLDLWSAPKKTGNGLQATINEKGYITLNAGLGEIFV